MKFEAGQTVYDEHGQEFVYAAKIAGEHIAQPVFETRDGDEPGPIGQPVTVRALFAKPPVVKLHTEIAALDAQLSAKRVDLQTIRSQISEFATAERDRLARIKRHNALAQLDEFLAGKITHFAVKPSYGDVVVKRFAEATEDNSDRYRKELKLLTLYGCSKGDLQFRINQYSDGSGSSSDAIPCTSEEQATALVKEWIATELVAAIETKATRGHDSLLKNAVRHGVEVPPELADAQRQMQLRNLRQVKEKQAADLAATEAAILATTDRHEQPKGRT